MNLPNKLTKFIVIFGLAVMSVNPILVFAQPASPATVSQPPAEAPPELPVYNAGVDQSIKDYLCAPSPEAQGQDLIICINRLFKFGASAGALLLVFFIVYAGYLYISGAQSGKEQAKKILMNTGTGLAILLGGYLLLYFINPNLVSIKRIQPPIFDAGNLPSCEEIGFNQNCIITTGGNAGQVVSGGGVCAMPIEASAVKSFNNTVHNSWTDPSATGHRTVRRAPNSPDDPKGAVDLAIGKGNQVPVYSPINGKVDVRRELGDGTGGYVTITGDTRSGGSGCSNANQCANLAHIDANVAAGDQVTAGQQIGKTTLYRGALGPHLHFELKLGGQWITGDGKGGTWENMKSSIASCKGGVGGGGGGGSSGSTVAVDVTPLSGMTEVTESSHGVKINMKYATSDNFTGTALYKQAKCYMTSTMSTQLKKAQQALTAKGKTLEIYDCYRPKAVQELMVAWAKGKVDWARKQAKQPNSYLGSYIATGGNHPLGKAVDLTISGASMPSNFDEFSTAAHYKSSNADAKLLRDTMTAAGFSPFNNEWWHFSE
ncbi:peptidoglycan DD-metalloendopeptidase family protein [bacterium]|nr:MAG: peptidoglycan DD-metalloendopeptidase family protein [bacterium]